MGGAVCANRRPRTSQLQHSPHRGNLLMTAGFAHREQCAGEADAEHRTQFGVYCIVAYPLLIGIDIRKMAPLMSVLDGEVLAIAHEWCYRREHRQPHRTPGWQGTRACVGPPHARKRRCRACDQHLHYVATYTN
mmetsp:Transcript_35008/g.91629  ORF Transcript_35008/g.91629 Transcript_35008/m.91629 type:complete len:134 (-) Transcript_35008:6-407(-)